MRASSVKPLRATLVSRDGNVRACLDLMAVAARATLSEMSRSAVGPDLINPQETSSTVTSIEHKSGSTGGLDMASRSVLEYGLSTGRLITRINQWGDVHGQV